MPDRISGLAVAEVTAGLVLAWSGIKNQTVAATLKSVLSGHPPADIPEAAPLIGVGSGSAAPAGTDSGTGSGTGGAPPAPSSLSANQALGRLLAAPFGWSTGAQWDALVALWTKESGWSNTADTRKSGLDPPGAAVFAYGIPQARPYSKMPEPAWPPDKGGISDPTTQILWGLNYIKGTYGSAGAAWAHEESSGWY